MKKSHYKAAIDKFEFIEEQALEDFRTRRPLNNDEEDLKALLLRTLDPEDPEAVIVPEMDEREKELMDMACMDLMDTELFREFRAATLKEINRMEGYLRPGRKYPLLARNPVRVRQGRRFCYVGVDGDIHIGRKGKPLKVAMATE